MTDDTTRSLEEAVAAFKEHAHERHESRGAEEYLKVLMKSSHYIDNLSVTLSRIGNEIKTGTFYRVDDAKYKNVADRALRISELLKDGLTNAERLSKNERQLRGQEMSSVNSLFIRTQDAMEVLDFVKSLKPSNANGLSETTIIEAQSAYNFVDNKLRRKVSSQDIDHKLSAYNESYSQRMATAQLDHRNGRINGHKQRRVDETEAHKARSVSNETRRTGVESFREREAGREIAAAAETEHKL